ncbi:MAG: hypothetical protein J6Z27_01455 [Bacteroidales bacterium]|nr:hypothetical protein [Bacteroidales bacterium]
MRCSVRSLCRAVCRYTTRTTGSCRLSTAE